jgi:DNA-binding beta-propeller fold protein YncE
MRKALLAIVILALLLSQSAAAASYPITISYGRSWPFSIAVDSARGLVYVDSTSGENPPVGYTFGVINATSHSLIRAIPLDEIPGPVVLDQATGEVYVAGNYSIEAFNSTNAIGMLDTAGHQILGMTYDGSVSPDIFFTSGNSVFALDPGSSKLVRNATVPNGPYWPVLDPANGDLYVSEYLSGEIAVLSASTLALLATIALPTCCAAEMVVNPKTQTLYASTGTNAVDMINVATGEFEKGVQVTQSSQNSTGPIALDNETNRVYVGTSPGGSIIELDGSSGAVVGRFLVQSQVVGLGVDPRTQELYATNYHQVTVFDAARTRSYRLLIVGLAIVIGAAGLIIVYVLLKRKDERERMRVQSGYFGSTVSG